MSEQCSLFYWQFFTERTRRKGLGCKMTSWVLVTYKYYVFLHVLCILLSSKSRGTESLHLHQKSSALTSEMKGQSQSHPVTHEIWLTSCSVCLHAASLLSLRKSKQSKHWKAPSAGSFTCYAVFISAISNETPRTLLISTQYQTCQSREGQAIIDYLPLFAISLHFFWIPSLFFFFQRESGACTHGIRFRLHERGHHTA